jgi:hypothetical protein
VFCKIFEVNSPYQAAKMSAADIDVTGVDVEELVEIGENWHQ